MQPVSMRRGGHMHLMVGCTLRSEELDRPENKDLKDIVKKLKTAKAAIDATSAAASAQTIALLSCLVLPA